MQQLVLCLSLFVFLSSLKTEANIEAMKSIPTERLMIETGELEPVYCNNNKYIWSHWVILMFQLNGSWITALKYRIWFVSARQWSSLKQSEWSCRV